jgi:hypothetical protein
MLAASSAMPVANHSAVVISEASGAVFTPGTNGRIRIRLPPSLGMIDMKSSYLQFQLAVIPPASSQVAVAANRRDCYNMTLAEGQGVEQLFRDVRILMDGRPIEEISNYPTLAKAKRDFCQDAAQDVLDSTFDKALSQTIGSGPFCQVYGVAPQQATYQPSTKVICKLDCSGVLSMPTGLPIVATGAIDIELDLADAADCLCPSGQTQNIPFTATQGNPVGVGFTTILIPPQSIFTDGALGGFSQAGYLNNSVAGALATTPFALGNTIQFGASTFNGVATPAFTGVQAVITAAAAVGANIQLTVTTAAGAFVGIGLGVAADPIVGTISMAIGTIQVGAAFVTNPTQYTYQITQPEYVVRAVEMPPPYIASLQKRIQSEQLQLDIPTYSTYLSTIQAGITQQAISVPAFQSRVQSIITIPQPAAQVPYAPSRDGQWDSLRSYQSMIGARREPSRPVDTRNTTQASADGVLRAYPSQEHIHELTKAFEAAGHKVRSLRKHCDNCVMGRSLSAMGGSEDLSSQGYRLETIYAAAPAAKNARTYVYHLTRVNVSPAGVEILQ